MYKINLRKTAVYLFPLIIFFSLVVFYLKSEGYKVFIDKLIISSVNENRVGAVKEIRFAEKEGMIRSVFSPASIEYEKSGTLYCFLNNIEDNDKPDKLPKAALSIYPIINEFREETSENEVIIGEKEALPIIITNIQPNGSSKYVTFGNVSVKNVAGEKFDIEKLLGEKVNLGLKPADDGPQVLIYHTHATECYSETGISYVSGEKTHTEDETKNLTVVGKKIADCLENRGIKVIHSMKYHDLPTYSGSYARSYETIEYYLKKYPTIKVILDIHRDALITEGKSSYRVLSQANGQNAAQMMIVVGRGNKSADNPNWKENFKFGLQLQKRLVDKYPTLMRPICLSDSRYNMHLSKGGLLFEIGTCANTLEESVYSGELLGNALGDYLNELLN